MSKAIVTVKRYMRYIEWCHFKWPLVTPSPRQPVSD